MSQHPSCPLVSAGATTGHRPLDISGQGYNNWTFMSTHYWDEDPQGLWTLGLENKGYYFNTGERAGCSSAAGDPAVADPLPHRSCNRHFYHTVEVTGGWVGASHQCTVGIQAKVTVREGRGCGDWHTVGAVSQGKWIGGVCLSTVAHSR